MTKDSEVKPVKPYIKFGTIVQLRYEPIPICPPSIQGKEEDNHYLLDLTPRRCSKTKGEEEVVLVGYMKDCPQK